jgi:nitrogenase molybdenum-iron protein alpha/beta subunit
MQVSTQTARMPFMVGAYLGVNACPDGYMVVDGPDCLFFKAEYVQGSQDLCSTLLDVEGTHRVAHTLADTVNVVTDREAEVAGLIRRVARRDDAGFVLVTALPMAAITGSQYDRLAREVASEVGKPVIDVPARSLLGDWLDGYGCVLDAMARGLPLASGPVDARDVAVVGLLVDRTEADQQASVREVVRLLEQGTGVRVRSVWPSNRPATHLAQAGRCGIVVSLPYGREAARTLAARTGARLVEADLPFGVGATARFVRAVAGAVGVEAEGFIEAERRSALPAIGAARRVLDGRRVAVITDPHIGERVPEAAAESGMDTVAILSTQHPPGKVAGLPGPEAFVPGLAADLCLATTRGVEIAIDLGLPWMEFSFPSFGTHALAPGPLLGFAGAVLFAERLANHVALVERLRGRPTSDVRGP